MDKPSQHDVLTVNIVPSGELVESLSKLQGFRTCKEM